MSYHDFTAMPVRQHALQLFVRDWVRTNKFPAEEKYGRMGSKFSIALHCILNPDFATLEKLFCDHVNMNQWMQKFLQHL